MSPGADGWQQIDDKREDVTGEDKGNDPFEDGGRVSLRGVIALGANAKGNGESKFDDDERGFDDEAGQQNAMLGSIEDAQAQILGTDEDGTNEVSSTRTRLVHTPRSDQDATYMNRTKKPSCRLE